MGGPSSEKGKKRKRGTVRLEDTATDPTNEVVDLLDSEEEREAAAAKKKRSRKAPSRTARQPAASSRPPVQQLGDVIFIED